VNTAFAVASVGTFAERRIESLLDGRASGLPDLLTPRPTENFGLMLVQYAAASIASENKSLAHPASVDSITTAAGG
jgi:histidine ammonia-lyase